MRSDLKPTLSIRVMDLIQQAGFDISDWSNWRKGHKYAASNPRYCYEWSFEQDDLRLINIWFEDITIINGIIQQKLNMRERIRSDISPRKNRAKKFDDLIRKSYIEEKSLRVIILDKGSGKKSRAQRRFLDPMPWIITKYDINTGDFVLVRSSSTDVSDVPDQELDLFQEGQKRRRFVVHRYREAFLRERKITEFKKSNDGKLFCEVPRCGFDFLQKYGELGRDFAHVHHLIPLSEADDTGIYNTLEDLAVVCPNCHAMIHRGGQCRDIASLIKE